MDTPANIIPADTPSIYERLQTLQTSNPVAYNAIVRLANPPPGIGGFMFDIPGDEEVRLKSAITRHWVENNTPVQDHIALEPEMVTLRGLIAELTSGLPAQSAQAPAPNTLPILPLMSPMATPQQEQQQAADASDQAQKTTAYAEQQSIYQYYQAFAKASAQSKQAAAFRFFQQLWWGRQILSVETPWGIYTNMAVADIRAVQGKDSKYISDFTIVFERIRVVGDITINTGQLSGRNALQAAPVTQNGTAGQVAPTPQQLNALYQLFPAGLN